MVRVHLQIFRGWYVAQLQYVTFNYCIAIFKMRQKSEAFIIYAWKVWNAEKLSLMTHPFLTILLMSSSRCGFQLKGHSSDGVGGHTTVQVSSCTKQLLKAKIFRPFSEVSCCSLLKTKVLIDLSREMTPSEVLFCDQGVICLAFVHIYPKREAIWPFPKHCTVKNLHTVAPGIWRSCNRSVSMSVIFLFVITPLPVWINAGDTGVLYSKALNELTFECVSS